MLASGTSLVKEHPHEQHYHLCRRTPGDLHRPSLWLRGQSHPLLGGQPAFSPPSPLPPQLGGRPLTGPVPCGGLPRPLPWAVGPGEHQDPLHRSGGQSPVPGSPAHGLHRPEGPDPGKAVHRPDLPAPLRPVLCGLRWDRYFPSRMERKL